MALGFLFVPSHWTSIWMDREFTAWVAPISNRLSGGGVLYTDGWHSPVPPLSSLVIRAVSGGHAKWITESALIFLFQCGLLIVMYGTLRAVAPRPVPFVAAIASVPLIFALPKTIFYDTLPQFLVSLALAAIARAHGGATRRWTVAAAVLCATTLMSKTNTGLGVAAGALIAIALFPTETSVAARLRSVLVFVVTFLAAVGGWLFALHRWVSIPGFVHDVLLTGSEPKGGADRLLGTLAGYPLETLVALGPLLLAAWVGSRFAPGAGQVNAGPDAAPPSRVWRRTATVGATLAIAGLVAARVLLPIEEATAGLMWCGLALLGGVIYTAWRNRPLAGFAAHQTTWARLAIVSIVAAAFHSVSIGGFRWTYDNNPLIVVAIAAVMTVLLRGAGTSPRAVLASRGLAAVFVGACYVHLLPQVKAALACRDAWLEISYLDGARLRPAAAGMRRLAADVKALAPDASRDAVLLLPEDPNVLAWLDRPRPAVTSAILFVDQYWDEYVDEDFRRLAAAPPKVIVIGPRAYWRGFSHIWLDHRGVERLIDRVQGDLLPARYHRASEQPISFLGRTDYMDVYVRID